MNPRALVLVAFLAVLPSGCGGNSPPVYARTLGSDMGLGAGPGTPGDGGAPDGDAPAASVARWSVSASVTGLLGSGLVLRLNGGHDLPVAADGTVTFATQLADGDAWAVSVATHPMHPAQLCSVASGNGTIGGAAVTVAVHCATRSFTIGGNVRGLGSASILITDGGGHQLAISGDGPFTFAAPLADGAAYAVAVATQPADPNLRCSVSGGSGTLDGANVSDVAIGCGAPGNLRINEVGSCYWSNSSCWLEVYNASSTVTEQLSTYQLRTQSTLRVSPWTYSSSHTFALPALAIPPNGYALVRGRASDSLVDGGRIVHVVDGDTIPWWGGSGFVELLAGGRTIDFVRFGTNTSAPTTSSSWAGGDAPTMPFAADAYGWAIARDLLGSDSDRASDWSLHAFGTPGGRNDITSDSDSDGDGIPDQAEHSGATYAGLDLYAMGARTGQRDLFLQIDRMASTDPGITPQKAALDKVVAAFAAHGIALHPDVGDLYAASFDPARYNLGGGSAVPYAAGIALGASSDGRANFYAYKSTYMDVRLHAIAYYMLFANSQNADGSGGSSGLAEVGGNDALITLGSWGLNTRTQTDLNVLTNYQAGTIMHEFGHNLGLLHGGFEGTNYKANYVSVMNYMYQLYGLPTIGNGEGDRYALYQTQNGHACGVTSWWQLRNGPTVDPSLFVIDYSDGASAALDENDLDDSIGFGRTGSMPVDFDCDQTIDSGHGWDTNVDGSRSVLSDYDDWGHLVFVFQRRSNGNDSGATPSVRARSASLAAPISADPVAHDLQPLAVEPAPPAAFFAQLRALHDVVP